MIFKVLSQRQARYQNMLQIPPSSALGWHLPPFDSISCSIYSILHKSRRSVYFMHMDLDEE